jgi:hypothetical protein
MALYIIALLICLFILYKLGTCDDNSKYVSKASAYRSGSVPSSPPSIPPFPSSPASTALITKPQGSVPAGVLNTRGKKNNPFMPERVAREITRATSLKPAAGGNKPAKARRPAKPKNPIDWFVVKKAQEQISEAEKIIAVELDRYRVDWYREVAFEGLRIDGKGYARYDFLLITPKGIHLIEYDGRASHSTDEQRRRDTLKNEFCQQHNIPLTRYNRKHYYHLPKEISHLLASYNINKKTR